MLLISVIAWFYAEKVLIRACPMMMITIIARFIQVGYLRVVTAAVLMQDIFEFSHLINE